MRDKPKPLVMTGVLLSAASMRSAPAHRTRPVRTAAWEQGGPRGGRHARDRTAGGHRRRHRGHRPRYGAFYGLTGSQGLIAALRAGKLPVPRDGGGVMSWIHLANAAAATMAAMDKGVAGQAYNVIDEEPVTWGQMITEHAKVAGTNPPRRLPG